MSAKKFFSAIVAFAMILTLVSTAVADDFKIAIMQDKVGDAKKFQPLLDYLNSKEVHARFITARNYPVAANMFASGAVDGMFSGSGVAGTFIIKGLATPVVRPLSSAGWSTYWAVVLAPAGSPEFSGEASYFSRKSIIYCSLASSGEFYFRSIKGANAAAAASLKAPSHGSAIDALGKGKADVAIVKNRVWEKVKNKYPGLVKVGEDKGANPNGTLIVSMKSDPAMVANARKALLALTSDTSPLAMAAKKSLNILGYIDTSEKDFSHTISLLKAAGVDESFNFKF
jgi:ABC-type phosphate/phosphonate transport system substrate-binding protein